MMTATATILARPAGSRSAGLGRAELGLAFVLVAWFVIVVTLGASGAFVGRPGAPPIGIAIAVGAPLLLFFAGLQLWPSFRDFALSLDLQLIAGVQAWRWAGLGFIFLYAHHVLPAAFALTAGFGDMAVGLAAPWMILGLARKPGFAAGGAFVRWNALGILDLIVAVGLGASSAMLSTGAPGEISAAPMGTLPLLLVPAFLVPLFLMLHVAALMQSHRIRRSDASATGSIS
jgi:hypothetical protein